MRYLSFIVCLTVPAAVWAHGAAAHLVDPDRPGIIADESFTFNWVEPATATTTEQNNTVQSFYYTAQRPPTWNAVWGQPQGLEGELIVEGILESDDANAFVWDTSDVPAGSYWIWSIAEDPDVVTPFSTVRLSPYPLVVAHDGDEPHPNITLLTPADANVTVDESFDIVWDLFDPLGGAKVMLEYGNAPDGSDFEVLAENVRSTDGVYTWDTSWLDEDWYAVRATVEDVAGRTFVSYTNHYVRVLHPNGAAEPPSEEPEPTGCAGAPGIPLVALVLLLRRRRRA